MQEFARVCERAARAGGEVLIRMRGQVNPREKAPSDLVTEADVASQEAIRELVLSEFPDHDFLGEEDLPVEIARNTDGKFTWVVDPLDGTTNYVHGFENYCVSVALQRGAEVVAGSIFDPVRE
jgi:myo-inositol-1(or 4)-monophosphatase